MPSSVLIYAITDMEPGGEMCREGAVCRQRLNECVPLLRFQSKEYSRVHLLNIQGTLSRKLAGGEVADM